MNDDINSKRSNSYDNRSVTDKTHSINNENNRDDAFSQHSYKNISNENSMNDSNSGSSNSNICDDENINNNNSNMCSSNYNSSHGTDKGPEDLEGQSTLLSESRGPSIGQHDSNSSYMSHNNSSNNSNDNDKKNNIKDDVKNGSNDSSMDTVDEDHNNYHISKSNYYCDNSILSDTNNFENYVQQKYVKNDNFRSSSFDPIIEMKIDPDFCPDFTSDHEDDMDMESE